MQHKGSKTSATAVTCAHNQWWHSKKERNSICPLRSHLRSQNQWQVKLLSTNLKAICSSSQLLVKSMLKYLKKKMKKISVLLQQLRYEIDDNIYFLQEPKKSAWAVALLQNQFIKIQLKNLKYLPPQSLACEVYRKQAHEGKGLLPQSRRTLQNQP